MESARDVFVCNGQTGNLCHSHEEEEAVAGIQFSPPLYLQRYKLAIDYLTKHSVNSVIDFGCSECGFFRLLPTVASLQEIALVDIDRGLLLSRTKVISPQVKDYVHRRSNPLTVWMYAGSAGDFDHRMKAYQAVTLIEVIEHLHPDVLELVTGNVFGSLHPQYVLVTTPNAKFNVLFGNDDPQAFRHWDHKFEWTRAQFKAWCQDVSRLYGYEVEYSGVGFQPPTQKSSETCDLGPCSQAAFFTRRVEGEWTFGSGTDVEDREVYELIAQSEFPYDDNPMTKEEKLDLEMTFTLRHLARLKLEMCNDGDDDDHNGCFSIGVDQIANRSNIKHLASGQEVRNYLMQRKFDISGDGETLLLNMYSSTDDDDDDDDDVDGHINNDNVEDDSGNANVANDKERKRCSNCGHLNRGINGDLYDKVSARRQCGERRCDCSLVETGDCEYEESRHNPTDDNPKVGDVEECWDTLDEGVTVETEDNEELWDTPDNNVK